MFHLSPALMSILRVNGKGATWAAFRGYGEEVYTFDPTWERRHGNLQPRKGGRNAMRCDFITQKRNHELPWNPQVNRKITSYRSVREQEQKLNPFEISKSWLIIIVKK
jgi:hypothetical protein